MEKQIEEINKAELQELAGIITETDFNYWGDCWAEIGKMPYKCPFDMEMSCQACTTAKNILGVGYRKIDEGKVVLTREEYGAINLERATDMLRAIQDQARKETAKEILERFYNYLPPKEKDSFEIKASSFEDVKKTVLQFHNSLNDDIREFAKQYGVEIEL